MRSVDSDGNRTFPTTFLNLSNLAVRDCTYSYTYVARAHAARRGQRARACRWHWQRLLTTDLRRVLRNPSLEFSSRGFGYDLTATTRTYWTVEGCTRTRRSLKAVPIHANVLCMLNECQLCDRYVRLILHAHRLPIYALASHGLQYYPYALGLGTPFQLRWGMYRQSVQYCPLTSASTPNPPSKENSKKGSLHLGDIHIHDILIDADNWHSDDTYPRPASSLCAPYTYVFFDYVLPINVSWNIRLCMLFSGGMKTFKF